MFFVITFLKTFNVYNKKLGVSVINKTESKLQKFTAIINLEPDYALAKLEENGYSNRAGSIKRRRGCQEQQQGDTISRVAQ